MNSSGSDTNESVTSYTTNVLTGVVKVYTLKDLQYEFDPHQVSVALPDKEVHEWLLTKVYILEDM